MAIYDIEGAELATAYDIEGTELTDAYDIDGEQVLGDIELRVCQYNCGQWYTGGHDNVPAQYDEVYYALQSGMITNIDADILMLEEYTAQFSKAGRTALSWLGELYPYYHEQTNGTTTTVTQRALYSKYPITNYQTHAFSDGSGYYFDTCTITVQGIPITIACTHLHWSNRSYRAAEAAAILSGIQSAEYAIVGGDFNTEDYTSTESLDYTQVIAQFVDAGYSIANGGDFGFLVTFSNKPEGSDDKRLDNIIVTPNITLDTVTVDTTKITDGLNDKIDHMPLYADITVSRT